MAARLPVRAVGGEGSPVGGRFQKPLEESLLVVFVPEDRFRKSRGSGRTCGVLVTLPARAGRGKEAGGSVFLLAWAPPRGWVSSEAGLGPGLLSATVLGRGLWPGTVPAHCQRPPHDGVVPEHWGPQLQLPLGGHGA